MGYIGIRNEILFYYGHASPLFNCLRSHTFRVRIPSARRTLTTWPKMPTPRPFHERNLPPKNQSTARLSYPLSDRVQISKTQHQNFPHLQHHKLEMTCFTINHTSNDENSNFMKKSTCKIVYSHTNVLILSYDELRCRKSLVFGLETIAFWSRQSCQSRIRT